MTASSLDFRLMRQSVPYVWYWTGGAAAYTDASFSILQKKKGHPVMRMPLVQKGIECLGQRWFLRDMAEEPEQGSREQRRDGQREDPGRGDVADGGQLQAALVSGHGAGHA